MDICLWENTDCETVKQELQKVLPKESEIIRVEKIDKSEPSIDEKVCWAEYKVKIFNENLYDFEKLRYNTDRVLNSPEIFVEKKNKKGLIKKVNIKNSIGKYRFEDNYLLIVLKAGHSEDVPVVRADVLMNLIEPDVIFDITRTRFFTESLKEL